MQMEFHSLANIFPLMEGEEYKLLCEDIRLKGLSEPIHLYEGQILDGRNRFRACHDTGTPPRYVPYEGADPLGFVITRNLARRHLTSSQRAAIAVEAETLIETLQQQAKERQDRTRSQERDELGRLKPLTQKIGEVVPDDKHQRESHQALAVLFGTNRQSVADAKKLKEAAPDLLESVKKGESSISAAKREYKRQTFVPPPPVQGKYRVWYADPPWQYSDNGIISDDNYGRAERHYPTMDITSLCEMGNDIKKASETDAVLFLWVTSPMLEDAFKIINSWGFKYKASFVWDKVRHNFGHYNSVRHEFLLICTRGSCVPDVQKLHDSVITLERTGEHSEKPECFRQIIDEIYPVGNRIELFARKETPNWERWGDENAKSA